MRTRALLIMLSINLLAALCVSAGNYITQESLDEDQRFQVDADTVQLFPGHTIDTTLLHKLIENVSFGVRSAFSDVVAETSDTSCLVIRIDRDMEGLDEDHDGLDANHYFISLFGEICRGRITKLYLYEMGAPPASYFGLTESAFSLKCTTASKRVELTGVMKAMSFQTAGSIRYSYGGPHGTYDYTLERYMIVRSGFTIPEEFMKFFPQVFEP